MATAIYAGEVNAETLIALIRELRIQAPHTVVESPAEISFPSPDDELDAPIWEHGRIFGEPLELRWCRQGDEFYVVLTCEDTNNINKADLMQIEILDTPEVNAYYLWGEDDVRIGRPIAYRSIAQGGRAQLVVAEHYDSTGDLHHWRYMYFKREN